MLIMGGRKSSFGKADAQALPLPCKLARRSRGCIVQHRTHTIAEKAYYGWAGLANGIRGCRDKRGGLKIFFFTLREMGD